MSKITIYLSLKDGKLNYRDSEKHHGKTINSIAKPGDKICWTLDENSGIKDLTGINIKGHENFFSKEPCKKSNEKWTATIAKGIKGEVAYFIFYSEADSKKSMANKAAPLKEPAPIDPPIIKVP
ncbi:MAG: hypothetical protein JXA77_02295 [Bacteroidales bacterium]|nr:hypothetical protein [Bacteroidales bacterium]MBN2820554.1 hypothetical protein [Bacteroidales bacterium]